MRDPHAAGAYAFGDKDIRFRQKFIQKNFKNLTQAELTATSLAMQALQLSLELNDKNLVQTKTEELNDISRPYAERIMDNAISKAMAGKKI